MGEEVPQPSTQPELINSVPGFDRPVADVAKDVVDAAAPGSRENPVIIDNQNFMGDPRRVIGHPSNPNNGMMQALADDFNKPK